MINPADGDLEYVHGRLYDIVAKVKEIDDPAVRSQFALKVVTSMRTTAEALHEYGQTESSRTLLESA